MDPIRHRPTVELEAGLEVVRQSPKAAGELRLIVRRPRIDAREVISEGHLDRVHGLVGDTWKERGNPRTADGAAHPDKQLTIMNARAIALLASGTAGWPLAGDQLYVDLDLSEDNLPPGTRLSVGAAVIVVTDQPHTGCKKFAARFGIDALAFVNSPAGRQLKLRGIYARVVESGRIRVGDVVAPMVQPA